MKYSISLCTFHHIFFSLHFFLFVSFISFSWSLCIIDGLSRFHWSQGFEIAFLSFERNERERERKREKKPFQCFNWDDWTKRLRDILSFWRSYSTKIKKSPRLEIYKMQNDQTNDWLAFHNAWTFYWVGRGKNKQIPSDVFDQIV